MMSGLLVGSTPAIDPRAHPRELAVLELVPVNESRQWVLIRTGDTANPIVLFVHGGPGTSQLALMRRTTRPLEAHFIVVNWDQRGAGKSFAAGDDRSRMTIAQFVDDIIDLPTFLARRFGQRKVLLVGHAWGTVIGTLAVAVHRRLAADVGRNPGPPLARPTATCEKWSQPWTRANRPA